MGLSRLGVCAHVGYLYVHTVCPVCLSDCVYVTERVSIERHKTLVVTESAAEDVENLCSINQLKG